MTQIKRWNQKGTKMRNIIISLIVVSLVYGCSTTPSSPKPDKAKFTFQCLYLTVPSGSIKEPFSFSNPPMLFRTQAQLEDILTAPNTEVMEFPIVIAGIGESVTNDQTKALSLPEDYDIINGEAVAKNKTCNIGESFSVTLIKVESGAVTCKINPVTTMLKGFDEYVVSDGVTVKMPMWKKMKIDSEITLEPNLWTLLGGLIDQRSDGTSVNNLFCIRVLPPKVD